jgi:hypothetical protein
MIKHYIEDYREPFTHSNKPEFIRLPRAKERCPHTGLSRSYMNQLILPSPVNGYDPPVKSRSLKKRGHIRGIRLIIYDSLIGFLNTLGDDNESKSNSAETPK